MVPDRVIIWKNFDVRVEHLFLLVIGGAAALLLLSNLDGQILWQDEAQTATIAKTILHHGIPKAYDGKNFFSQEYGAEFDPSYVWKWHTWLSFYIVAASFHLLGATTFAARLPFVLFGIATIILTYYFALSLFRNRRLAAIACFLLLISVPFLLLSRQCRYYSATVFFSLLGLWGYRRLLEEKRFASSTFVVAAVFLFQTHYIYFATLLGTLGVHALMFCRHSIRRLIRPAFLALLINLPWMFWFSNIKYGERYNEHLFNLEQVFLFGKMYLSDIMLFIFPLMLLIFTLFVYGLDWWKKKYAASNQWGIHTKIIWLSIVCFLFIMASWAVPYLALSLTLGAVVVLLGIASSVQSDFLKNVSLLVLFIIINLAALLLTVPFPYFRYLAPLIPVLIILSALLIERAMAFHPLLGILGLIIAVVPNKLFDDYIYEITHSYKGPMEGIVRYLQDHGAPEDTVLITYEDLPLKFYTSMRVVGGLTGENLAPYTNPQWVILRKYPAGLQDSAIRNHARDNIIWKKYERISLPYPDIRYQNREDPRDHVFRTVQDEDSVSLFRRIQ